jgi:hypothetical protein
MRLKLRIIKSYGEIIMKIKLTILLFSILLLVSACASSNQLALGKYIMKDAQEEEFSWVLLEEDNRFTFNRHIATSYRPSGTYKIEDDLLILTVNEEEIYTFKIMRKTIVFQSGKLAEGMVDVGTVYELKRSNNPYSR